MASTVTDVFGGESKVKVAVAERELYQLYRKF